MSWKAALAVALVAGCYQPDIGACRYACAAGGDCPSGLECNGQNLCAASATDHCDPPDAGDAGSDSHVIDVPECGWHASNVNPCALDALASTTVIEIGASGGTITADANSATLDPDLPGASFVKVSQANGGSFVWVLVAKQITISGPVKVVSEVPIVFLANEDIHVTANVSWNPPSQRVVRACAGNGGAGGQGVPSGGGGGGGYGIADIAAGAAGGPGIGGNAGVAGTAGAETGNAEIQPLQLGCNGGDGGPQGATGGTAGGAGGGALQFSSHGTLVIDGEISVGGGGGSSTAGTLGAGGGGAGGAILLEAHTLTLGPTAALCANGGGGGGTGTPASPGQEGQCPAVAAPGGGSADGAVGGAGAYRSHDAVAGVAPFTAASGASGGGGGVGRIRLNGAELSINGIVTPLYTMGNEP